MQELSSQIAVLRALLDAVADLENIGDLAGDIHAAVQREIFTPLEDEKLWAWFSRFLSVREELWAVVESVSDALQGELCQISNRDDWRQFVLGYTAAIYLAGLDKLLLERVATEPLLQRKLNESCPSYRIPRKQYTRIFEAWTNPDNALLWLQVRNFSHANRHRIRELADDEWIGDLVGNLSAQEQIIQRGFFRYLFHRLRYRWHSFRRRGASARQKSLFQLLETGGRIVSRISNAGFSGRVETVVDELEKMVQPGDVFVTRHDFAASNLFLPGFWPHAALYIGTEQERDQLGVQISKLQRLRWKRDKCILEADSQGVLFRALRNTLKVDSVVLLRPQCSPKARAMAISRACEHEGKGYNFDFDFFRSDKLVCTEVVYRAYDGMENMHFSLTERAGRYALSAEDILDMALEGKQFKPVALFGVEGCNQALCCDEHIDDLLARSYRTG
jgi:hypothetical protein